MATCSENLIKRVTLFTKRSIIQVALIDFEKSLKLNVPDENMADGKFAIKEIKCPKA